MAAASQVISIAKNEIGYLEKKSNASLDSKTANAGSNNYTKYARDFATFAGANFQGQAWCDMFVDWCFVQAFGVSAAKTLLGGFSAYTPTSAQYFKNKGQWHTSNPKVGDVVFFKNSTRINHTGLVIAVSGGKITTVEGNTSAASGVVTNGGGVAQKSYSTGYSKIAGYGRPAYSGTSSAATMSATTGLYTGYSQAQLSQMGQKLLNEMYGTCMSCSSLKCRSKRE